MRNLGGRYWSGKRNVKAKILDGRGNGSLAQERTGGGVESGDVEGIIRK